MKDEVPRAGVTANAVNARAPTPTAEARAMRWIDGMSQCSFPVVPYWLMPRGRAAEMTACAGHGPRHAQHPLVTRRAEGAVRTPHGLVTKYCRAFCWSWRRWSATPGPRRACV